MKRNWAGRFDARVLPPEPKAPKGTKFKLAGSIADDPMDLRHGTVNGYVNYGCRCDKCKAASSRRHKQRVEEGLSETDPRHGTESGYLNWGCRCESCKAGHSAAAKKRRAD